MPEHVLGSDVMKVREQIYSFIKYDQDAWILDIGCGYGYDLINLGNKCGTGVKLTGLDSSGKAIDKAREKTKNDPRFNFIHKDIELGLPFDDGTIDVIYSCNLLECVQHKQCLLAEVYRILKPGGQVVFSHIDWDTQVINGNNKPLIRRIVAAFSDWTQGWMKESDGWMGRRIWGLFQEHGGFSGEVIPLILVNDKYTPGLYGHDRIRDIHTMAINGVISKDDLAAFQEDIDKTISEGKYFYSVTYYVFYGKKV